MSPTQRTMRLLREAGSICAVVEKWNPHVGPHGIRQDLFGIIDILVLDPERGVIGVQACSGSTASHYRKLTVEMAQESIDWLSTPSTVLQIWCWRKVKLKRGGKAVRWMPKVTEITMEDFEK